jgi:hypothetical protein
MFRNCTDPRGIPPRRFQENLFVSITYESPINGIARAECQIVLANNNSKTVARMARWTLLLLIAAGCDVAPADSNIENTSASSTVVTSAEPAPTAPATTPAPVAPVTTPAPETTPAAETAPAAETTPAAETVPAAETAPVTTPAPAMNPTITVSPRVARFIGWLDQAVRASEVDVANLYYAYYDAAGRRPWFLSPMVTADVLRFFLRTGDVAKATAIGDALLRWQHDGQGAFGDRLAGAFPSELDKVNGRWVAKELYDSHDNLVVLEALLDLHAATAQGRFLQAGLRTGVWLRDVMARGDKFGLWTEAHGAPMKGVTTAGNFDNRIAVGRTLLWLPTLRRLATVAQDDSFATLADSAEKFLMLGQEKNGGFADHYDPGYPAQAFDAARFRAYGADGSVVADDSIRAAIGALQVGNRGAAEKFTRWLSRADGRIAGYLALETGKAKFLAQDREYHDVMSTALYERLAEKMGMSSDVAQARAFLEGTQGDDGSWFWGVDAEMNQPVNADQATLIGLWTFADLCPRA